MKTSKYYKQMLGVTIAAVAMSLFWLYWTVGRSVNTLMWDGVQLRVGYESLQIGIILSYCMFSIALVAVQLAFLIKQLACIKRGLLFDKSSVKYLVAWAVLWVFYDFCSGQLGMMVLSGVFDQITVEGTVFGIPAIAVAFAILYSKAADVAEENNLTI